MFDLNVRSQIKFFLKVLRIIDSGIIVRGDKSPSASQILKVFIKMCRLLTIFTSLIVLYGSYFKTSHAES